MVLSLLKKLTCQQPELMGQHCPSWEGVLQGVLCSPLDKSASLSGREMGGVEAAAELEPVSH